MDSFRNRLGIRSLIHSGIPCGIQIARTQGGGEMKLIYIAGPYTADTTWGIVQNIRKAEQAALEYWRKGYAVICPHKNTALFDGAAPDGTWLEGDLEMLRRCDALVRLPDWHNSPGARREVKEARELGIPIWEYPDEGISPGDYLYTEHDAFVREWE